MLAGTFKRSEHVGYSEIRQYIAYMRYGTCKVRGREGYMSHQKRETTQLEATTAASRGEAAKQAIPMLGG